MKKDKKENLFQKPEFFTHWSEDFRTPLALLLSPLKKLFNSKHLSAQDRLDIDLVSRNAQIINRNLNDLFEIAALESDDLIVNKSNINVAQLVSFMCSHFFSIANDKNIQFTLDCPNQILCDLDIEKFQKIFLYLLANAFKRMTSNGSIEIQILKDEADANIHLRVIEKGSSIDLVQIHKHFGYHIILDLVQLHNGTIRIENKRATEIEFKVILPFNSSSDLELNQNFEGFNQDLLEQVISDLSPINSKFSPSDNLQNKDIPLVLIMSENSDMNVILTQLIQAFYRTQLSIPENFLEQLEKLRPNLVICDAKLMQKNQYEFIKSIHTNIDLKNTPLLVLTSQSIDELKTEFKVLPNVSFLAKPFSNNQLLDQVINLLKVGFRSLEEKENITLFNIFNDIAIVAVTDRKGAITFVNERFCAISGYAREELLGQNHRILNSGFHPKEFFKEMWRTISSGKPWHGEVCNKNKKGDIYWMDTTIMPVMEINGIIEKYVSTRFEITERKKAEQKLIQSSKMASLGEMAGGVAHEINNPLSVIIGKVEYIKTNLKNPAVSEEKIRHDLAKIRETADRISKIVKGLRTFSRSGEKDPFDIVKFDQVIQETLSLCSERFKLLGVDLIVESDVDIEVHCRATQISQVLLNLLNNSVDAIEKMETKWVKLQVKKEDDLQFRIDVTDCGNGIPAHIAEKLMNPFYTTKEVGKGTGLGLSISKGIIEDHNGKFFLDKTCPNTRFSILLPIRQDKIGVAPTQAFKKTS